MIEKPLAGREAGPPKFAAEDGRDGCRFVEALVATALGVPLAQLRAAGRGGAAHAFARHVAMYLAHVTLGESLSAIARHFQRHRTTVGHACARVEDRREHPPTDRLIDCLEAAVKRWKGLDREDAS
jgi:hypothetical protein